MTHLDADTADRVALRGLVERYAAAVDARDADAVAHLFTEDGRLVLHLMPGTEVEPVVRSGRVEIAAALGAGLTRYRVTTHVIGGQVLELDGTEADGVTLCLAHHVLDTEDGSELLVMAIRYHDRYVKEHGLWRFAERRLRLDWRERRHLEDRP
jgi:uncharacterized protein (TIGR02246 family)